MIKPTVQLISFGQSSYASILKVQQTLQRALMNYPNNSSQFGHKPIQNHRLQKEQTDNLHFSFLTSGHQPNIFLLVVEHFPVYTAGLRDKAFSQADVDRLKKTGAEVHRTNRGGLATFHGLGQLVVYPIINLNNIGFGLREYVSRLEKCLVRTCTRMNVNAHTTDVTGVWVGDRKIASIGVYAKRHVTSHGIALNCCTDLSWFEHIVPCGLEGVSMTSLSQEAGSHISVREAEWHFLCSFVEVFELSSISLSEPISTDQLTDLHSTELDTKC